MRVYVANARDCSISVIDSAPRVRATWQLPETIRVHDVSASADGAIVWAVSGEHNLVLSLDAISGVVLRRFTLQRTGGWMLETGGRISPGHCKFGGSSGHIALADNRRSTVDGRAWFTPDGRTALVIAADSLIAFDPASKHRTGSAVIAAGAKVIAVSADVRRAYITHPEPGLLTLIDVPTMTVVRPPPCQGRQTESPC